MRRTRWAAVLAVAVAAILFSGPGIALSQDDGGSMAILREKIRADRKLLVASNMELTDAEAKAFWPLYDRYFEDLEAVSAKAADVIEGYARNYESMTDEQASALLDAYLAYEADRLDLRKSYRSRFAEVVPEKKVARFYQIENKIHAVVAYELASKIPLVK